MGRKPKYENPQAVIDDFFNAVSDSFNSPLEGEQGRDGHKKQELLADEFGISRIKVRKILITTGDISYPLTNSISALLAEGKSMDRICEELKIGRSTALSLIPYTKGVYKLSEVSAAAERTQLYRARKTAITALRESIRTESEEKQRLSLWKTVCIFDGYPFTTSGRGKTEGMPFKYEVSAPGGCGGRKYNGENVEGFGNEIFIIPSSGEDKGKKREKGISRSSVDYAFKIAMEEEVNGPKQLRVYRSSYIFSMFVRFGLISSSTEAE